MADKFSTKSSEKGKIYTCKKCDFVCYKKSSYDRHLATLKHQSAPFPREVYKCEYCDYTCRYKSEYDKHISTLKHINQVKRAKMKTNDTDKQNSMFYCKECDYTCQYSSLFEKHKNTSKHINNVSTSTVTATTQPTYNVEQTDTHLAKILEHHSKQTEELKNFIIHHSELLQQRTKEHQQRTKEHQQQMKEQQEQNNKQFQEIMDIIKQAIY